MSKTYVTLMVLVVLVGGAFLLWRGKTLEAPAGDTTDTTGARTTGYDVKKVEGTGAKVQLDTKVETAAAAKEFTVTGSNYSFSPNAITVKKGDKVKITFKNSNGFHNFVLDEFNVTSKTINGGASDTVEFTADKTGSFRYYCSVGNHRAMGMWGTLKVE
jgi:plastocyanin